MSAPRSAFDFVVWIINCIYSTGKVVKRLWQQFIRRRAVTSQAYIKANAIREHAKKIGKLELDPANVTLGIADSGAPPLNLFSSDPFKNT